MSLGALGGAGEVAPWAGVSAGEVVEQLPEVPTVALLKGVKDTGPRVGGIGHLLLERG